MVTGGDGTCGILAIKKPPGVLKRFTKPSGPNKDGPNKDGAKNKGDILIHYL